MSSVRRAGNLAVWALAAVALTAAAVLNYMYGAEVLARISTSSMDIHADFETFWASSRALLSGGEIYDTGARLTNLNPPLWALLTAPLAFFAPLEAYYMFVLLMLALSVGTLSWMAAESRIGSGAAVVVSVALVLSSPLMATLALGQMYPVLAFGLVGAWAADRRGMWGVSGVFLGLVVAFKPSLAPVLLWPLFRRRWEALGAAVLSGAAATLLGVLAAGPRATFSYVQVLLDEQVTGYWDNASLHSTAIRFFSDNDYTQNLVNLSWVVPAVQIMAIGLVVLTAYAVRGGSEWGLWAVVAASLMASPVTWHNYLVLLAPAVMLLVARRWYAAGALLIGLQLIPAQWTLLWSEQGTLLATAALSLYSFILVAHWMALISAANLSPFDKRAAEPGGQ